MKRATAIILGLLTGSIIFCGIGCVYSIGYDNGMEDAGYEKVKTDTATIYRPAFQD